MPSPEKLAADTSRPWERLSVTIYGRQTEIDVKTQICLWYQVGEVRPMRMIVTRDPKGRIEDRAFLSTDPCMTPEDIIQTFAKRWEEEVLHRNLKQCLGLEDPQNGGWRRPAGRRRDNRRPGAEPHAHRGEEAVRRTLPFVRISYALVVVWYLTAGNPDQDVARARLWGPWYRHKTTPSFADTIGAARRQLLHERGFDEPGPEPPSPERSATWRERLMGLMLTARERAKPRTGSVRGKSPSRRSPQAPRICGKGGDPVASPRTAGCGSAPPAGREDPQALRRGPPTRPGRP